MDAHERQLSVAVVAAVFDTETFGMGVGLVVQKMYESPLDVLLFVAFAVVVAIVVVSVAAVGQITQRDEAVTSGVPLAIVAGKKMN